MRNEIMSIANQRKFMITPTPVDIDAVNQQAGTEWNEMWGHEYMLRPGMGWEDPQNAYDIDSVGKGDANSFGKRKND